ncbi:MAG: hypothetical protein QNL01_08295 [Akkermansiaceae bacterium]|jgi:hypothetical protein|tara:strand:- start:1913 stop:2170 length:258 start_codon:yes stop_codon:yes gene_type:complete
MNNHSDNNSPANSTTNFKDISDFLGAFAPEVSGRSTDAVTPELQSKLASLAAGNLAEDEGRGISRELLSNENAMKTLADMISQGA